MNRKCKCLRPKCGHTWRAKGDGVPAACPKCKSYYWNRSPKIAAQKAVPMVCTKCEKPLGEAKEVYLLEEGIYNAGQFQPNGSKGLYCGDCAPPASEFPFES